MKKCVMRFLSVLMCVTVLSSSLIQPVTVTASSHDWYKDGFNDIYYNSFRESWNDNLSNFKVGCAGALASEFNGEPWYEGYLMGRILQTNAEYYDQPSLVFDYVNNSYKDYPYSIDRSNPYYYAYQGFEDNTDNALNFNFNDSSSNDYSTTNRYEVFQDNSNYNTNNYNFNWYNPITNNYNNCDTFYFDNSTNSYYYQTIENNYSYDNYVIDNSTYVTYYIVQTDVSSGVEYEFLYDIYYKLPDGRSSYDLRADDVWGEYFVYDIVNYDSVAEDDGTTLGLWHLDNNGNDSSYWNNSVATISNVQYSEGVYGSAKYLPKSLNTTLELKLDKCDFDSSKPFTLEWVEYMPDFGSATDTPSSGWTTYYSDYTWFLMPDYYSFSYGSEVLDSFVHFALVFDGSKYNLFVNGIKKTSEYFYDSFESSYNSSSTNSSADVNTLCGFLISDDSIKIKPFKDWV